MRRPGFLGLDARSAGFSLAALGVSRTLDFARAKHVHNKTITLLHIEADPLWCGLVEAVASVLPRVIRFLPARNGTQGLAIARSQRPDIVLLDLQLPDFDGFALSRQLAGLPMPAQTVLLSGRTDDVALHLASQPHIAGLLWKTADAPRFLPEALSAVAEGRKYFTPAVSAALRRFRADPAAYYKILSDRELEMIPYFGHALTDGEIAARLSINLFTVRSHRQRIMQKLGVHRGIDLIHWAIRTGLVPPI